MRSILTITLLSLRLMLVFSPALAEQAPHGVILAKATSADGNFAGSVSGAGTVVRGAAQPIAA